MEVGTRPEIDLLQASADQANAQVALISAQNDYAAASALLNQAMGVERPRLRGVRTKSAAGARARTEVETLVDAPRRPVRTSPLAAQIRAGVAS